MRFVWDESKNAANIRKHTISFAQAHYAFLDPLRKEYFDNKHSSLDEDRYILLGFAENSVLHISYTEPEPETFRIISARRATRRELEVFQYGNG